jgi:hypothetical protein
LREMLRLKILSKTICPYFLCDNDTNEIRRIIDVEWREKLPGKNQARAQYHLVCKLVAKNDENYTGDDDLKPYLINESMHDMIRVCPAPYNTFQLMQDVV